MTLTANKEKKRTYEIHKSLNMGGFEVAFSRTVFPTNTSHDKDDAFSKTIKLLK